MSESDPLDRPATPEEIEMVERLLKRDSAGGECGPATEGAAGAEEFDGGAGVAGDAAVVVDETRALAF